MSGSNNEYVVDREWFEHSFGPFYPVLYAHRTVEAAAPEARFALDQCGVGESDRVLDLCCGTGRHMVHLLTRTAQVVGLDYSPALLATARRLTKGTAPLVRADMRAIPFLPAFDVVVNFFTSFGYFFTDAENRAVAQGVGRVLRKGGRLFMDYINGQYATEHLVPESERTEGEYRIHDARWIHEGRVNKVTRVYRSDTLAKELSESVRMYSLEELQQLLSAGGMEIEQVFGDYTGVRHAPTEPRMIVIARKV